MTDITSATLFAARRIRGVPRDQRPRCGAVTRAGGNCKAQALLNRAGEPGRCRMHGGLSTGPRTAEGKTATAARAREAMRERWARYRAENGGRVPLTEEGREKLRQTARRTMRLRHRKREALAWAAWLTSESHNDSLHRYAHQRRKTILRPFLVALEHGGMEELRELAAIAGIDLSEVEDDDELTGPLLARYAPRFDLRQAAEDLRRGASMSFPGTYTRAGARMSWRFRDQQLQERGRGMLTVCRQLLTLDRISPLHARVSPRPAWGAQKPETPQDYPKAVAAGAAQKQQDCTNAAGAHDGTIAACAMNANDSTTGCLRGGGTSARRCLQEHKRSLRARTVRICKP